ncbi:hypothetical protein [Verrucosispora sp. TAA-831]|uniref:hypothetical protein n=1 Tax=Verrucosispora sp. TAA-831 TaxID=3422227 RepID=UPI003D6E3D87
MSQLHEIVAAVTVDEPPMSRSVDQIVAAGRKAERRRRAGFASAGAAGLVVAVVAGTFALTPGAPGTAEPPTTIVAGAAPETAATWSDAPPFSFTFRAFDAGPLRVQDPVVASTAYQIAAVYLDGRVTHDRPVEDSEAPVRRNGKRPPAAGTDSTRPFSGYLTLYRPGAFDPAGIVGGTASTIAGRQAVESAVEPAGRQLAWEYADDAWAVVTAYTSTSEPSIADLSALVTALEPSPATPATLPFRVGYLPAGHAPVEAGTHALPGLIGISQARAGNYGGVTYADPSPATTGLNAPYGDNEAGTIPGSVSIYVMPASASNQRAKAGKTKCHQVSGDPFCNRWTADGAVQVQVLSTGGLSVAELTRIVESVEVTDVNDENTWVPVLQAR